MNNLASIRNCLSLPSQGPSFYSLLTFFLSNDSPVIIQVFITIHEYANTMIYIFNHRMNGLVQMYHFLYNNTQCKPMMFFWAEIS